MTDQAIHQIINAFNTPGKEIFITHQRISNFVNYALVWDDSDFHNLYPIDPYHFYIVQNEEGMAVAAVLDMTSDLHIYVIPEYRKQGHMTRAMQSAVLPHLSRKRKSQRITITRSEIGDENFEASFAVAKRCGFRVIGGIQDKTICTRGLRKYNEVVLDIKPVGMDHEQMAELRKDMNVVAGRLAQVNAVLALRLGESRYTRELRKTFDLLEKYRIVKMDDALYDFNESSNH